MNWCWLWAGWLILAAVSTVVIGVIMIRDIRRGGNP